MTLSLDGLGVGAVLLDIEGTTTPIAFVHETLFPFARARLSAHFRDTWETPDTREAVALLEAEHRADVAAGEAPPAWDDAAPAVAAYAAWLMDRDRKSTGLKLLQGHIWERGYQDGRLHGEIYPDVAPAIRRWRAAGRQVAIYSSGSALAQRRLFASVDTGDLTPLFAGFFDTRVGAKVDAGSYRRIASELGVEPGSMLFVSDVVRELDAARAAGLVTALSVRPGNPPQPDAGCAAIRSFDELA